MKLVGTLLLVVSVLFATVAHFPSSAARPKLTVVFVIDGLRPDSITSDVMPNLARLKSEGAFYLNSHSVFPTVTRVNAAVISTGMQPNKTGIVANSLFVREVNPREPFTTSNYRNLLKLAESNGGRLLPPQTLAEAVEKAGLRFVAASSGSTGNAILLNATAPNGTGVLINGGFDPNKKVAFPESVNQEILRKFGAVESDKGFASVEWTEKVVREHVLTELKPDVLIDWMTEPDTTQHRHGVSSPEALSMLKQVDDQFGLFLEKLRSLDLYDQTNILVLSDHGFSRNASGVAITESLIKNNLKAAADSDDVVLVSEGSTNLLYVRNKDRKQVEKIVRYLQAQPWTGAIFTPAAKGSSDQGWLPGTFSLELIHEASEGVRAPDILFTLDWSSEKNRFGVAGSDTAMASNTGPIAGDSSGHGSMNPFVVTNTMILWGPGFRASTVIDVPSSNVDVMPTILASLSIPSSNKFDGRVLSEAFRDGPEPRKVERETRLVKVSAGTSYQAVLQYSTVGAHRYIDKSWRIK
jgi:predicted AlkP superfamily pyrophosphatase or phosphodiesterase